MRRFLAIAEPVLQNPRDGEHFLETKIQFTDGSSEPVAIPVTEIPNIIGFFIQIAEFCSAAGAIPDALWNTPMIGPISLHGTGLALGTKDNDSEILLVLDAPGARFSFQFSHSRLDELLNAAAPILQAAAAPRSN